MILTPTPHTELTIRTFLLLPPSMDASLHLLLPSFCSVLLPLDRYAGLDHWAAQNQRALRQLLRRPLTRGGPRAQPGQRTVFGEWCARTHTKKYDQLPSKFVAFDVWDASLRCGRGGFVTAATRNALLHSLRGVDGYGSRLFRIRCIARRTFTRVEEIVSLLCDSEEALSVYASMSGSSSSASVGLGRASRPARRLATIISTQSVAWKDCICALMARMAFSSLDARLCMDRSISTSRGGGGNGKLCTTSCGEMCGRGSRMMGRR